MPLFNLTPELLQKGLTSLGIAAGQAKHIDEETKSMASRFAMRALASGDLNGYLKEALRYVEARDNAPPAPRTATARVVAQGELVDDEPPVRRRR